MRVPYRYAAPWFGYWSYLSERSMGRWKRMSEEVDARQYGTDKMLCDVLQFWNEASNGWFAVMRSGCGELPRIFFLLEPDTESACREIDFFAPACPQADPEVAYLRPISGDPEQINETKCCVHLSPSRHSLVVHLENLEGPLSKGVYEGMIHVGDEPVAALLIKVAAASQPEALAQAVVAAAAAAKPAKKPKTKKKGAKPGR